jgi:polyamine oxidase
VRPAARVRFGPMPLTRRRLLELAAAAGAVAVLPETARAARAAYDDGTDAIPAAVGAPERVVIVGAGFAGLAAANALRAGGVECVVLDARDRTGGRAHTAQVGAASVDVGASWVHEPDGNVMARYARQAGVALTPASPEHDAATIRFLDDRTGVVPAADTLADFARSLAFDERLPALGRTLGAGASTAQAVARFLDDEGLTGDDRRRVGFMVRLYAQLESAEDWDRVPAVPRASTREPRPNHRAYTGDGLGVFPQGGYRRLVRALAAGTDVRLGHRVTRVERGARGVAVHCTAGRRTRVFRGSHVLVTVPLGVLKAGTIRFDPPLPAAKRRAIERIGFGAFEKVAVAFPEPFWTAQGSTHLIHVAESGFGFPLTIDLQRFAGVPALVALNAGAFARALAGGPAAGARDQFLAVLRRAYGDGVPAPTAWTATGWATDPFSRGSYSATVLGTRPDDRLALAAPAGGRVLFAGEATNLDGRPSTTDGALSTGLREAKRLLRSRRVALTAG